MRNTLESEILAAIQELNTKLKDEMPLTSVDLEVLIVASMLEESQNERK